jgi:hypothetical protein
MSKRILGNHVLVSMNSQHARSRRDSRCTAQVLSSRIDQFVVSCRLDSHIGRAPHEKGEQDCISGALPGKRLVTGSNTAIAGRAVGTGPPGAEPSMAALNGPAAATAARRGSATADRSSRAGGVSANGPGRGGTAGHPGAVEPGQTIRRAADGNFDAVVVQNSLTEQFPEARGC